MAQIDRDEVERMAQLARLRLAPEETAALTTELVAILDHVAQLAEVDTTGIEPTSHGVPLETPLREDEVTASLAPERAIANAPAAEGSAFAVPSVMDDEDEG